MQVFLHGLDGSVSVVNPTEFSSVDSLLLAFNAAGSRIVYQGSHLDSLDELQNQANLYVTGDLDGGKKKKKKKVYTTKKKGKHIHKKIKMGIYSLYSVDSNYQLIQTKEMFLNPEKLVLLADQEPSWVNIGTDTTVDSAILPSRWIQKLLRRTKKS